MSHGYHSRYVHDSDVSYVRILANNLEAVTTGKDNPPVFTSEPLETVHIAVDNSHRVSGTATNFVINLQAALFRVRKLQLTALLLPRPPNLTPKNNHFNIAVSYTPGTVYTTQPNTARNYPKIIASRNWMLASVRLRTGYYNPESFCTMFVETLNDVVGSFHSTVYEDQYTIMPRFTGYFDRTAKKMVLQCTHDFFFSAKALTAMKANMPGEAGNGAGRVPEIHGGLSDDTSIPAAEKYGFLRNGQKFCQFNYTSDNAQFDEPTADASATFVGIEDYTTGQKFMYDTTLLPPGLTNDDRTAVARSALSGFASRNDVVYVSSEALNQFSTADSRVSNFSIYDDMLGMGMLDNWSGAFLGAGTPDTIQTVKVHNGIQINVSNPSKLLNNTVDFSIRDEDGDLLEDSYLEQDRPFLPVYLIFNVSLI